MATAAEAMFLKNWPIVQLRRLVDSCTGMYTHTYNAEGINWVLAIVHRERIA